MSDYTPDPLWSMATTPGETYQGWANRLTKKAYDWLIAEPVRMHDTRRLAVDCLSMNGDDYAGASVEFARRLDLHDLVAPRSLAHVDFGQLFEAFLES